MKLATPLAEEYVRGLTIGDRVLLSGTIVTARDAAHKYLFEGGKAPCSLNAIYHCGPIIRDGQVLSAGPTTSLREEPYQAKIIADHKVRAVIGKGGMGENTLKALKEHGCAYLSATGGAGALIAKRIKSIKAVHMEEELGSPEAFWEFEVVDMPLVVTMDCQGGSLHERILRISKDKLEKML